MKPSCWVITEGMAGTENQCLGVAEALGLRPVVKRIALRQPWKTLSPYLGGETSWTFSSLGDALQAPWPRIAILAGRKAIPAARYIKRLAGDATFTVFIQDPRVSASQFDLVAVPQHDSLRGDNVIVTSAAPNRINSDRLEIARRDFAPLFAPAHAPRVAVLIGGTSKAYDLTVGVAKEIGTKLRDLTYSHAVYVTMSRRTGQQQAEIIRQSLGDTSAWIWDGNGDNPYFGMLAWADHILVTADSVSMISEAATTGTPVSMFPLPGGAPRIESFHSHLIERGILRIFQGNIESWHYSPLNDAALVAEMVKKRLKIA